MNDANAPTLFIAKVDSNESQFDAWSNQPLLVSAEMGSIDWPSSCRNGTCRTCIGRLISGSVRYEIDWPGLSADEKFEGLVLPCCAFPCSDVRLEMGNF